MQVKGRNTALPVSHTVFSLNRDEKMWSDDGLKGKSAAW